LPFTILLVEEDRGGADALAELLRARGYRVWTANRARDALWMMQRGWVVPSLVLLGLKGPRSEYEQLLACCAAEP
jgi:DNA-binding response OmpR family regulator